MYVLLCEVANTPVHVQGDELFTDTIVPRVIIHNYTPVSQSQMLDNPIYNDNR